MPNLPYSSYNVADRARGELAADITASSTTFSVNTGQGASFPASNAVLVIGTECVYYTTRTGDSFTGVTRGYSGAAAQQVAGTIVYLPFMQAHYQRFVDNLSQHTHNRVDIPDFSHTHPQGDIANLVSDLAAKAASVHVHAAGDITTGVISTARLGSGTPSASNFLRGDGAWAAPTGGADPWTVIKLASDFTTSSASAVDVTGLALTPAANQAYMFEALLLLRTALATVNPRVGWAWSTGLSDGVVQIDTAQTATTRLMTNGNIGAAVLSAVGGLPNTTQSWPSTIWGSLVVGASPSGTVRVQLASETAGTNVTVKAGSYLRYRTY